VRASLTIILRMLLESDQPQSLRGTLQAVTQDAVTAFSDEEQLLELLHQILRRHAEMRPAEDEPDEQ